MKQCEVDLSFEILSNAVIELNLYRKLAFYRSVMIDNARHYDETNKITFRQRLALRINAKQYQRPPKFWV